MPKTPNAVNTIDYTGRETYTYRGREGLMEGEVGKEVGREG